MSGKGSEGEGRDGKTKDRSKEVRRDGDEKDEMEGMWEKKKLREGKIVEVENIKEEGAKGVRGEMGGKERGEKLRQE